MDKEKLIYKVCNFIEDEANMGYFDAFGAMSLKKHEPVSQEVIYHNDSISGYTISPKEYFDKHSNILLLFSLTYDDNESWCIDDLQRPIAYYDFEDVQTKNMYRFDIAFDLIVDNSLLVMPGIVELDDNWYETFYPSKLHPDILNALHQYLLNKIKIESLQFIF